MFCFAAYFPFLASTFTSDHLLELGETEIELDAFRRAFALLVLRGFELFGAKSDGSPLSRDIIETSYADKTPRLTRIIFGALCNISQESVNQSRTTQEALLVQNIEDALAFTQPITDDSYPYGPSVPGEHFKAAATRLLHSQNMQSTGLGSSFMASKADLQHLTQLLLLVRAEDRRWKVGQLLHDVYQRSGDIQYAHVISDVEENSRAFKFAAAFVASQLGDSEDLIPWDVFKPWCANCVSLMNALRRNRLVTKVWLALIHLSLLSNVGQHIRSRREGCFRRPESIYSTNRYGQSPIPPPHCILQKRLGSQVSLPRQRTSAQIRPAIIPPRCRSRHKHYAQLSRHAQDNHNKGPFSRAAHLGRRPRAQAPSREKRKSTPRSFPKSARNGTVAP